MQTLINVNKVILIQCYIILCLSINSIGAQPNKKLTKSDILTKIELDKKLIRQNTEKASEAVNYTLKKALNIDFKLGVSLCYKNLGGIAYRNSQFDQAIIHYQNYLKTSKQLNNNTHIAHAYLNIAQCLIEKNNYYEANLSALEALKFLNKNDRLWMNCYQTLSIIQYYIGEISKSIEYADLAYKQALKYGDEKEIIYHSGFLISSLIEIKNFKKAYQLLLTIEPYVVKSNDYLVKCKFYMSFSQYYIVNKEFQKAKFYLNKAIKYKTTNKLLEENINISLSKIYFENKEYTKAKKTLLKILNKPTTNTFNKSDVFKILSDIEKKQGNFTEANEYHKKHKKISDSIIKTKHDLKILNLTLRYEKENAKKELIKKELEIEKSNTRKYIAYTLLFLLIITFLFFYFYQKQKNKINEKEFIILKEKQKFNKLSLITKGEENEKSRIARDLHDGINGDLVALKLKIKNLNLTNTSIKNDIDDVSKLLDTSINEIRNITHNLTSPYSFNLSLTELINNFCINIKKSNTLRIFFESIGTPFNLNKTIELSIYRIIQEATNNIIKHAEATEVIIQFLYLDNELQVTIEDNGKGFDVTAKQTGIGLINLKSRAELIDSKLIIESSQLGTTIYLTVKNNPKAINLQDA